MARRIGNLSGTTSRVGFCERSLLAICFIKSGIRVTSMFLPQSKSALVDLPYPTTAIFRIFSTLQPSMSSYSRPVSMNFLERNRCFRSEPRISITRSLYMQQRAVRRIVCQDIQLHVPTTLHSFSRPDVGANEEALVLIPFGDELFKEIHSFGPPLAAS